MSLSEEQRTEILSSLRAGITLAKAARGMMTTEKACRALAAVDPEWAAAIEAATPVPVVDAEPTPREVREAAAAKVRAAFAAMAAQKTIADAAEEAEVVAVAPLLAARANGTAADRDSDPETGEVFDATAWEEPPKRGRKARVVEEDDLPNWEGIRAEAAEMAPGPFGHVLWQEEQLAQRGFPRLSPCTLWNLEAFFASLKRWFLLLGGRGMGKSTLATRLAAVLGLLTPRRIPPGQTWIGPFISVLPEDAKRRLVEIQAIFRDVYSMSKLKITSPDSTPTLLMLDASGNSIAYVSFASTVGHVSGPNTFFCCADEEEKVARSAGEIVGSLANTFRARANIRGFRMSSALKQDGTLISSCRKGPTLTNYVATVGPFLGDAIAGLLEVALWEEAQGYPANAARLRAYTETMTADSFSIPSWVGNNTIGEPNEKPWAPECAAVATRIEAEAVEEAQLKGLTRYEYWMREIVSVPEGGAGAFETGPLEIVGEESRYAGEMAEDRGY